MKHNMHMSKKFVTVAILGVFLFSGVASAQTNSVLPDAGILPSSPFFFLERFFEGVGNFFTFGDKNKADRYLTLAEERLAEAQVLSEQGDEAAKEALTMYKDRLEKALQRSEKAVDSEIAAKITKATSKHFEILEGVREKALDFSQEAVEEAFSVAEKVHFDVLSNLSELDPSLGIDVGLDALKDRAREALDYAEKRSTESLSRARARIEQSRNVLETARRNNPELEGEFVESLTDIIKELDESNFDEEIQIIIDDVQEDFIDEHLESLQELFTENPEEAADTYLDIIQKRLEDSKNAFGKGDDDTGKAILDDLKKYEDLGNGEFPFKAGEEIKERLKPSVDTIKDAREKIKILPESDEAEQTLDDALKTLDRILEELP